MLGGGKQGWEVKRFVRHPQKTLGREGGNLNGHHTPATNLLSKPLRGTGMAKRRVRMRAVRRADGPRAFPGLSQLQIVQEQSLMRC